MPATTPTSSISSFESLSDMEDAGVSQPTFMHFELTLAGTPKPTEIWKGISACIFESTPAPNTSASAEKQTVGCLKLFKPKTRHQILEHIDTWNRTQPSNDTALTVIRISGVKDVGPRTETTWVAHLVDEARRNYIGRESDQYHKWTYSRMSNQLSIEMVQPEPAKEQRKRRSPSCKPPILHTMKSKKLKAGDKNAPPSSIPSNLRNAAQILASMHRAEDRGSHDDEIARLRRIIQLQAELLHLQMTHEDKK